jgi:hypothetical protein
MRAVSIGEVDGIGNCVIWPTLNNFLFIRGTGRI